MLPASYAPTIFCRKSTEYAFIFFDFHTLLLYLIVTQSAVSHRLHNGIGIILQTESKKIYSICPRCGTKSQKLHQNHRHIVKDLPFGDRPVFLEINRGI